MSEPAIVTVRESAANECAIIFIHGFWGEAHTTFGMLPAFLAGDARLSSWDIHCFGYPTRLAPDLTGVWSSEPDLTVLARYFVQAMDTSFARYRRVAIVAHSMGGLIV